MSKIVKSLVVQDRSQVLGSYSLHMVQEVYRYLALREQQEGSVFVEQLSRQFLSTYVGAVVFEALKRAAPTPGEKSKPSAAEVQGAVHSFAVLKHDLQEAIAIGFQEALRAFTGQQVEYYCQVKAVPDAPSKTFN